MNNLSYKVSYLNGMSVLNPKTGRLFFFQIPYSTNPKFGVKHMFRFINTLAEASPVANNVLTDGQFSLSYQQIPSYFEQFNRVFAENRFRPDDGFILEVENTLPTAVTLLYLLENACSVLLLPSGSVSNLSPNLPNFCRYVLATEVLDKDDAEALNPDKFLRITPNPAWNAENPFFKETTAKLLMRTSGSTGIPKMVVHSHTKLQNNVLNCVHRFSLSNHDRVAIPVPIYHMYGLGAAFLPSVAAGAALDLQKGANLLKFIQRETAFNPNVAFITPSFANTLLQTRKTTRFYRLTVTAGDRFRAESVAHYEAAFGPVIQHYGCTELGAVTASTPDLPIEIRQHTAGLPMPDVQFQIKGTDSEGELWCKRTYGFEGYVDMYGNPIDLGEDYVDGWFRTKDFARLSPEGYVEILGRSDNSVNRDGLLVFFADVEKTIETVKQVETVVVVAGEETQRGKKLIAYCVVAKGSDLSAETIRSHCFKQLPRRAVPDEVCILDAMPFLPNGKVDRVKLSTI